MSHDRCLPKKTSVVTQASYTLVEHFLTFVHLGCLEILYWQHMWNIPQVELLKWIYFSNKILMCSFTVSFDIMWYIFFTNMKRNCNSRTNYYIILCYTHMRQKVLLNILILTIVHITCRMKHSAGYYSQKKVPLNVMVWVIDDHKISWNESPEWVTPVI